MLFSHEIGLEIPWLKTYNITSFEHTVDVASDVQYATAF